MRNINTGNIIPFFRMLEHQSHRVAGSLVPPMLTVDTRLPPWQVVVSPQIDPGSVTWRLVAACDGEVIDMHTDRLNIRCSIATNQTVISYFGTGIFDTGDRYTALPCGIYHIEIEYIGTILYSDILQVTALDARHVVLNWANLYDIGGVILQGGSYQQQLITPAYFERPTYDEQRETVTDGYGNERVKYSRILERVRADIAPIHDASIAALLLATQCSTVTLTYADNGETINVTNLRIETRPFGHNGNVPTLTFDRIPSINTGCQLNDLTLETCAAS